MVLATGAERASGRPSIVIAAARSRGRSKIAALARLVFPRSAAARAGFDFALATLWRNKTHRLTLAAAAAIGFAMVLVALSGVDLAVGRAADGAAAFDSAVAVRQPAGRLPARAARAGGAARELGLPARLAGQGARVCERRAGAPRSSRWRCRRLLPWSLPIAFAGGVSFALLTRCSASPAR